MISAVKKKVYDFFQKVVYLLKYTFQFKPRAKIQKRYYVSQSASCLI